MAITGATTRAVNGLAVRWAEAWEERSAGGTVFSPVGVWPLLALLADGAQGAARAELAEAMGVPAEECAAAARELLRALTTVRGLESALGLWTARTVELREPWAAGLPRCGSAARSPSGSTASPTARPSVSTRAEAQSSKPVTRVLFSHVVTSVRTPSR